jgi:pyridoxal phosphate enzyme (YggS family)
MMSHIPSQLKEVQKRISIAAEKAERDPSTITLIAVSKTFPTEDVQQAIESGQSCFGESRFQEAAQKIADLPTSIDWHFIGRVQRNKVRKILPLFPTIHAIDSLKLAKYVNSIAGETSLQPRIFLQVDQANEETKGGFHPEQLYQVFGDLAALSHISIAGLMTIPPAVEHPEDSRFWFAELKRLRDDLSQKFSIPLPHLSMGMSGDYEIAIEEGATHVRVGSSIFGKRAYQVEGELGSSA